MFSSSRLSARALPRRLLASLVLCVAPTLASAQSVITLRADSTRRTIAPSSKLAVPVILDMSAAGGTNIASLTTGVTFGTNRLTFDSVRTAGFGTLTPTTTSAASGSLTLAVSDATGTTSSQTLATMYFTASATPGGTQVAFSPTAAGSNAGASILSLVRARALDVCVASTGKWGDVNGDSLATPLGDGTVNIIDAQQIARYSVNLPMSNRPGIVARGDVTNDGSVNIIDAQQIARFSVGLTASARVNTSQYVAPAVATVAITPSAPSVATGGVLQLTATPRDAGTADLTGCAAITWSSSDPTKATIDPNSGLVTGVAAGSATITATSDGKSASVTVTVVAPAPVAVAAVSATSGLSADVNGTVTPVPTVRVVDARNSPVAGVSVAFAIGAGGGAVVGASKQTGVDGTAFPDSWTLGAAAGANTLSATVTGLSGSPVTFSAIALIDTGVLAPRAVTKTTTQKLYMHYMPNFETPQTSPNRMWGMHWTMSTANPDIIRADGTRQIASFYYPLIGPYASSDRDVIDYHLLLMKYAGLDGVLVDWWGAHEVYDYPPNRRNTDSLFARVAPAGLQFAVVYEDQTLPNVKAIAGIDTILAAQQDFAYLQTHYFGSNSYLYIDGQPLLMVFGPQTMKKSTDWTRAFTGLATQPLLIPLNWSGIGQGEFAWPGQAFITGLTSFYQNRVPGLTYAFGSAYPGFNDYYTPGGWADCCTWTIPVGTSTLQQTLDLSRTFNLPRVQIATWNDYGEGTMIEPTNEFQFTFLETIQRWAGVPYSSAELNLVYRWYTLKKRYAADAMSLKKLDQAYYHLVSLRVAKAKAILDSFPTP